MITKGWRPKDVPQADDLAKVRNVIAALGSVGGKATEISDFTGYSDRHVRYRLQAARVLGLINEEHILTQRGRHFLRTNPGGISPEEQPTWTMRKTGNPNPVIGPEMGSTFLRAK